jgi:hypothetical protein
LIGLGAEVDGAASKGAEDEKLARGDAVERLVEKLPRGVAVPKDGRDASDEKLARGDGVGSGGNWVPTAVGCLEAPAAAASLAL